MSSTEKILDNSYIISRIERLPFTRTLSLITIVAGIGLFFDLFDVYTISSTIPALVKIYHLSHLDTTLTIGMGFIGMAIGGVLSGRWADLLGRRRLFLTTLIIIAVGSFLTSIATNIYEIWLWRLLTGFGIGGDLPIVWAYLIEMVPSKFRGRAMGIAFTLGVLSNPAAGLIAAYLLSQSLYYWRWVFVIGALIALAVYPIRIIAPESPRWYIAVGNTTGAIKALEELEKRVGAEYGKELPPYDTTVVYAINKVKFPLRRLFEKGVRRATVLATLGWIFEIWGYYGFAAFLPLILVAKGFTIIRSVLYSAIAYTASFIGPIIVSVIGERWQRKYQVIVWNTLTAVFALALAFSTSAIQVVTTAFMWYIFSEASGAVLYAYLPEIFPTNARATGGGFANSIARGLNVVSIFIIGVALAGSVFAQLFFIAANWLGVVIVIALAGPLTSGIILEELTEGKVLTKVAGRTE